MDEATKANLLSQLNTISSLPQRTLEHLFLIYPLKLMLQSSASPDLYWYGPWS